ncbi:hypothetical protein MRX96_033681 [Rhipicephalus microplus]
MRPVRCLAAARPLCPRNVVAATKAARRRQLGGYATSRPLAVVAAAAPRPAAARAAALRRRCDSSTGSRRQLLLLTRRHLWGALVVLAFFQALSTRRLNGVCAAHTAYEFAFSRVRGRVANGSHVQLRPFLGAPVERPTGGAEALAYGTRRLSGRRRNRNEKKSVTYGCDQGRRARGI